MAQLLRLETAAVVMLLSAVCVLGQTRDEATDIPTLLKQGSVDLERGRFREAAAAFQKVVDLNPSSAKGQEGLGVALSQAILAGQVRPSADSDVVERAEGHLKQASELSPSSPAPLAQWSRLEAMLAERSPDPAQRSERYRSAQELLKRVIGLEPGDARVYLQLAQVERDEFGPVLQQAKAKFPKSAGPLPDATLRQALQQRFGSTIEDSIANAQKASEMNAKYTKALLLTSRILRERALLRDTQEQYASDMHRADDWQRQFLTVGGHLEGAGTGVAQ